MPLTVGYHKVSVDIRDQIARTVIEESFVNHTDNVLEGVFYFPLPQDASISGFGMWIGDNLVEADVVEKQRAREIYETILREKRDPGLLEWSGGNIFKARVFPIPANSEKRIKITYTQVLPLKGSRYRYSYALQSELLQQHPLRELTIDVKVNSVRPAQERHLADASDARSTKTTHSAHVEFTAQEYTPTRDFEVVVEVEGRQADVVMIPHRRGDDGYFMLQLTPPGAAGNWDRPLVPNGEPLHLLILADTSASIDAGQRATQTPFIGVAARRADAEGHVQPCNLRRDLRLGLREADAGGGPECHGVTRFPGETLLARLDRSRCRVRRRPQAMRRRKRTSSTSATASSPTATPTRSAFTKRLQSALRRPMFGQRLPRRHARQQLRAGRAEGDRVAGRRVDAARSPASKARRRSRANCSARSPSRRCAISRSSSRASRLARVYPEALANIPAGTQQILLGRYLPDGAIKPAKSSSPARRAASRCASAREASFKDAEQGNSFIPRLWARMHLDSLLEQGSSETIKDEIIALSEEFQIITPYTSLLVLETDADRERFKVKRRFQMRDGERFFADGRDNAVFDLAQKQMKKAGTTAPLCGEMCWRNCSDWAAMRRCSRPGGSRSGGAIGSRIWTSKAEKPKNTVWGAAMASRISRA